MAASGAGTGGGSGGGVQSRERLERLAGLFQQIEKEFDILLEENADCML
jgi:molybdenum-dependent DNA-binding transcriptional regulator ModE